MATIVARKRRDGSTGYKVQWRLGGRRDAPWQSETFDNRRAAVKFQAQVEAHGHLWPDGWVKGVGFLDRREEPTGQHPFGEYAAAYVRRLTGVAPYTQTRYLAQLQMLDKWLRQAKGVPPTIENITTEDDQDWINARRRAGASPKTIGNYHGLLSGIMKSAVRKGLIPRNPCDGVRLPASDDDHDGDDDKTFLTEPEFALLREAMHADSQDFVTVAVGTGLRWGELTAVRVSDLVLDGELPIVIVRRAWKWNGSGEFAVEGAGRYYLGAPKTKGSRRRVTISPSVVAALRRAVDGKRPDDLVFAGADGAQLNQSIWYDRRWRTAVAAARQAGLTKSPRFHDLRHTHAAWLISAGVPLPVIQRRLGHTSIKITVDVYGGLLLQTHEIADTAVERALRGQPILVGTPAGDLSTTPRPPVDAS